MHLFEEDKEQGGYRIRPDFLIGYIDVENKKIFENELYSNKHDYTGLIADERCKSKYNIEEDDITEEVQADNDFNDYDWEGEITELISDIATHEINDMTQKINGELNISNVQEDTKEKINNMVYKVLGSLEQLCVDHYKNGREYVLQEEINEYIVNIEDYINSIDELVQELEQEETEKIEEML